MVAKLVAVGDSLTQGFQSGSISRAEWSYPAMAARAMGVPVSAEGGGPGDAFRVPDFSGAGGLPVNLERLFRRLGEAYGASINIGEYSLALGSIGRFLGDVEDYWERGPGSRGSGTGPLHHNLAVWGFEFGDCDTLTEGLCRRSMPEAKDQLWVQNQIPEFAMYRTARRVLNPGFDPLQEDLSQIDAVERVANGEGIGCLLLFLGCNNVLGTCTAMKMNWSHSADFHKYAHERACNIWDPSHFEVLVERVYTRIAALHKAGKVEHVVVGTVPHVTIAPVARGISPYAKSEEGKRLSVPERSADGFYEYYTHFWVWDKDFCAAPHKYPRLTRENARQIDRTIDQYNACIREHAAKKGWHVVDYCKVLDQMAYRRQAGHPTFQFPGGLVAALEKNPGTKFRVFPAAAPGGEKRVLLDTRYFNVKSKEKADAKDFDAMQRKFLGGLFSLDAIHPTTVGYGIMAHKLLEVMQAAGVKDADPARLDWDGIVAADTLLMDLPRPLENLQDILGFMSSRHLLARLVRSLSGYGSQEE
jgi:hypothetical protein